MSFVQKTGRTVEEAVQEAVRELGVTEDEVEVEVVHEGNKGFLGLLGSREACVRVTLKRFEPAGDEAAVVFVKELLDAMKVPAAVETREAEDGVVLVELKGEGLGLLIGRRGQTLDAIQLLVNVVGNKRRTEWVRFVVDAESYRKRKEESLRRLALRVAERVRARGQEAVLEPMSAMERRIVHLALQDDAAVETMSEGKEPFRKVVIKPRRPVD
ncbi:MAG: protein jag [Firmicutes bacterium]|nr:protein jag [Bacillota bacterium]